MKKTFLPLLVFFTSFSYLMAAPAVTKEHIHIDQFGYLCNAQKIAVISNPQTGYNSADSFTPGTAVNNYKIKRWSDDVTVFQGTLTAWNGGATHAQSGDRVWWFDFTGLTTPGEYYVYDQSANAGSFRFRIGDDVYQDVLRHAVRSFYYQRCGAAKTATHAGAGWADAACHVGALQDTDCRLFNDASNPATSRNLSGGWHDAGDYNKYVNFTWGTLIDLLTAYEENPAAWTDDYNIPESGNGIPDLLDEIKFELDWLLKMQQANGSVLSIVGVSHATPPSAGTGQSRYGPANTSATLTCASVFALAAIQFRSLGIPAMTTYSNTLETAAINAWNWANANPNVQFRNNDAGYGSVGLGAGQQETDDYGRLVRKISAAVFLYALNGNATYRTFVESNYNQVHLLQWGYAYLFEVTEQDMLLYYTKLAGINATVANNIRNAYSNSVSAGNTDNLPSYNLATDAYRAFMRDPNYTWGSNASKGRQGNMFASMNVYGLNAANATNYTNAASGFIHYLHGVNPNAWVYLTNMNSYGAEKSVNELYHTWFHDGSALWDRVGTSTYGPAPGILTGGANPTWSLDGCCPGGCGGANAQCITLTPPQGQPVQKSYRDWNTTWPQNSWSVTENGIYYQAAYIKLLSKFVATGTCGALPVTLLYFNAEHAGEKTVNLYWKTQNEKNNDRFEIERSTDGVFFEKTGEVKGQGTTLEPVGYFWKDSKAGEGLNYYRLKQVDDNGEYAYSSIRMVNIEVPSFIYLYPNPAGRKLTVEVSEVTGRQLTISVTGSLGQKIWQATYNSDDLIEINTENFSEGLYLLTVTGADRSFCERFVVKH